MEDMKDLHKDIKQLDQRIKTSSVASTIAPERKSRNSNWTDEERFQVVRHIDDLIKANAELNGEKLTQNEALKTYGLQRRGKYLNIAAGTFVGWKGRYERYIIRQ